MSTNELAVGDRPIDELVRVAEGERPPAPYEENERYEIIPVK